MTSTLEVLHVPGCPNVSLLLERLREVTDLPVTTREIHTTADAEAAGMAGSPTLLVDGRDPFGPAEGRERAFALSCRIHRDEQGRAVVVPSTTQLRAALASCEPGRPGAVLSAWRTRALPPDPVERAMHQAILRTFATTGQAPTASQLAPVTAGSGRAVDEVLAALHDLDAIRRTPDGQIAVAYPFSAHPTRHRVRIGSHVDVYAMCAVDALGMSAMLGTDTRIDSTDVTNGHAVTVTTTAAGHTSWDPPTAVVFLGADAVGRPSADCCCDYLNFFTDRAAATAWTVAHPHVPGRILTRAEAEQLGAQLFGQLLAVSPPVA